MAEPAFETARDPREIHQRVLDVTGRALMTREFDAFSAHFHLPQQVDSFDGLILVETPERLRQLFDGICTYYRDQGVTELVRTSLEASFQRPDKINCTHESRLLRGNTLVNAPFCAFSVLIWTETGWKVSFSQYAIADAPVLNVALTGNTRSGAPTS